MTTQRDARKVFSAMPLLIPSPKQITPSTLTAVWLASLVSTVLLPLGVVFFLDLFVNIEAIKPDFGPYVLVVGTLLAAVSLALARRFRAARDETRASRAAASGSDDAALRAYAKRLFIGLGIAETPCYAAIFYYLMTADVAWTLALCAAAIFLVMLYKPAWPVPGRG